MHRSAVEVHPPATKRVVLVIEDDPDMRDIIVSYLATAGWDVTVGDASALERVDALVLDVRSLATAGFRILGETRMRRPDLPVVVITSFGDAYLSKQAEAMGAATVLEKPFSLEDLERALGEVAPPPS